MILALSFCHSFSRWWQLKYFSFSLLFGEDFQFDEHIFQVGWFNHQLVFIVFERSIPRQRCNSLQTLLDMPTYHRQTIGREAPDDHRFGYHPNDHKLHMAGSFAHWVF